MIQPVWDKDQNSPCLISSMVLNYLEVINAFANLMEVIDPFSRKIHNHRNVEDCSKWFLKPSQEPQTRTLA